MLRVETSSDDDHTEPDLPGIDELWLYWAKPPAGLTGRAGAVRGRRDWPDERAGQPVDRLTGADAGHGVASVTLASMAQACILSMSPSRGSPLAFATAVGALRL